MKKALLTMLCVILVFQCVAFAGDLGEQFYLPAVTLGEPIEICKVRDVVTAVINGKDYMFTTSQGTPVVFNAYNLDDKKLIGSFKLAGTLSAWIHVVDSRNNVYIAADGLIFKYNPYNNEMKALGRCWEGETASFVMTKDEKDNIYIGTYPSAKIIKYDAQTEKFVDLGRVDDTANYVRAIAYHNGSLYAGTFGNNQVKFYQINANNPSEKKSYDIPENSAYYDKSKITWLYTMNAADDLIVINARETATYPMLVFDTKTNSFVEDIGFKGYFKGLYSSQPKNNKSYFFSTDKMYALNTVTKKVEETAFATEGNDYLPGSGWVTIENNPDFPGESLLTVDANTGCPKIFNFETNKRMLLDDVKLDGGKILIQAIEKGSNDDLYMGGYMSSKGIQYDTKTGETLEFPIGQTEGMVEYKGKQYFGVYTKAELYEFDPTLPPSETNPKKLAVVGEEQDRPFAMVAGDDKIFLGTIPDYAKLGGAIAWYDLTTQQMTTVRNVVQDQSVMSIAYKDGLIYGSTSIYGGLGSTPIKTSAKIFIYDVNKKEKIKDFAPKVEGINTLYHIGGINFDKNGKLWAVSGYTLFSVDLEKEITENVKTFGEYPYETQSHAWRPIYIRFDEKGYLYANLNGLKVFNTEDMSYIDLSEACTKEDTLYNFSTDNNLYFAKSSTLKMIPIENFKISNEDLTKTKELLKDKLGLCIDNPLASANGTLKYIDGTNKNVVPVVENGRTLVPLRFIAEALGATVTWDENTNTANLVKDGLTIQITIGISEMSVNGTAVKLDVPADTREGRTLLPLRAIAEAFSKQVYWDDRGVIIISDEQLTLEENEKNSAYAYFKYYSKEGNID